MFWCEQSLRFGMFFFKPLFFVSQLQRRDFLDQKLCTRSNLLASVSHMLQLCVCVCVCVSVCRKNMGSAMARLGSLTAVERLAATPAAAV